MPLVLQNSAEFELEVKRSRFIALAAPITSEDEARNILETVRAHHKTANHNVYAYSVGSITRASDDGEPSGTAGLPVLNVFQKAGVTDFVCVVTRYFGGTLLGAGGLVRAYSKSAKGAMDEAQPSEFIASNVYTVTCPYPSFDKLKHSFGKIGIEILETAFTHEVELTVRVMEPQSVDFFECTAHVAVVK